MLLKVRFSLLLGFTVCFLASAAQADLDYAVKLKTATFTPDIIADASARSAQLIDQHVLIQFEGPVDDQTRQQLSDQGLELLEYVPNYTYTARITRILDQSTIDQYGIRWFDRLEPVSKIAPILAERGITDWARRDQDRAQYVIVLHADEDLTQWAQTFETDFDAEIIGLEPSAYVIDLVMSDQAYYRASELDAVTWVKLVNPPQEINNSISRVSTQAGIVQAAPYNLSGAGITVAEWDGGHADQTHPDLIFRVSYADATADHYHATHVAGTIMGDGTSSGGTNRGMAPAAELVSWLWWGSASEAQSEYSTSQIFYDASVANNSWGLSTGDPAQNTLCLNLLGNYLSENRTIDNIVRGGASNPFVICWSAGNERSTGAASCGSLGYVYNTIGAYATSKNIITVGAISGSTSSMASFSSWGPTDDGRLKPDVVGPGIGVYSTNVGGGYLTLSGTSMSSPAVAGCAALLLEQGEISFPGRVYLSSTIKGLLINTATDLGNVGPDYSYGHGKVQVQKAVDKIMDGDSSYVEAEISTGVSHTYDLTVPSEATMLKVTLVWDDPGATVISGPILVNDLDLVVIDPFTNEEFPWVLNPGSPSSPATKGIDGLNNVESVTLNNPVPGLWKARVTGTNIPIGPQKYSLILTPDAINTPGNLAALAVYSSPDVEIDPGAGTTVEFWVSNVGASADSVQVELFDNSAWLTSPNVDTTVFLDVYDSIFFSIDLTVPVAALAWDTDSVTCRMTSKTDGSVTTRGNAVISVSSFFVVNIEQPVDGSIASPDTVVFSVTVANDGNDTDDIKLTPSNQFGWQINPAYQWAEVAPGSDTTLSFTAITPAEEIHLSENVITIDAFTLGGAVDTITFTMTVSNPFPPPNLLSPDPVFYTQSNVMSFSWDGVADSFNLYIAQDPKITIVERTYTGLTQNSFDMPLADSLFNGGHYWAVRLYSGSDSSSLQKDSRKIVIDWDVPNLAIPTSPINGLSLGQVNFLFLFQEGGPGILAIDEAPEFYRIEVAPDENFTTVLHTYDPVTGISFTMPDVLPPGRWYWRIQQADSAGNISAWSEAQNFVLDTETPVIPTLTNPVNGGTGGGPTVLFKWTTDAPAPYDESPEYYYLQIASDGGFNTTVYGSDVFETFANVPNETFLELSFYYWRVRAIDSAGHYSGNQVTPFWFQFVGVVCGDVNNNGAVNVADLSFLVSYLFGIPSGPAPEPITAGWVNCDHSVNVSDVTFLVSYLFGIPPGPPPCCGGLSAKSGETGLQLVPVEPGINTQSEGLNIPSEEIKQPTTTTTIDSKLEKPIKLAPGKKNKM